MGAGGCGGGHWAVVGGFGSWVGVVWAGTGSSIDALLWVLETPSPRVCWSVKPNGKTFRGVWLGVRFKLRNFF